MDPTGATPDESPEGISSELDLFSKPLVQRAIETEALIPFYPTTLDKDSVIDVNVKGCASHLDCNSSSIQVCYKVVKADGTDMDAGDDNKVAPRCGIASMFRNIEMEINGQQMPGMGTHYPIRAYMSNLLSYSKQTLKARGELEGWLTDDSSHMDAFKADDGTSFKERAAWVNRSKVVETWHRPVLEIFHQPKLLVPHTDIRLKFYVNSDKFFLATEDNNKYKFVITKLVLWMRRKIISSDVEKAHLEMRVSQRVHYPINRVHTKHITVVKGQTAQGIDNVVLGTLPDTLFLCLIEDDAMTGNHKKNPYNFKHFNLNRIVLLVNGDQYPQIAYNPDWDNNQCGRPFHDLLDAVGCIDTDKSCGVTLPMFKKGFTIFAFKIAPINPAFGVQSPMKVGNCRLEMEFSKPTDVNINAMVLWHSPGSVEIDQTNNVIVNGN
jgi:hypothetical protein